MSALPEIWFTRKSFDEIVTELEETWRAMGGGTIRDASPERLLIQYMATILCQQNYLIDQTAKQNVPRYAEGENLDSLADIFYQAERLGATAASATLRFTTSIPLPRIQLVPQGTRVATLDGNVFETDADLILGAGETEGEVTATCQETGTVGNGYGAGEISVLVDVFPYFQSATNITESAGGSDRETDEALYRRMRESMEGYTTAGSAGAYEYWAKSASSLITAAKAVSPRPNWVTIYIMQEGRTAPEAEILSKVAEVCSRDNVKPLTDVVEVKAPTLVEYQIDLTWYVSEHSSIPTATVQRQVTAAVESYKAWQSGAMGRHLNPTKLVGLIYQAGASRVEVRSPVHTELLCGPEGCQVAECVSENVVWGGIECE